MADDCSPWWLTIRAAHWHITKTKASYLVQRLKLFMHTIFGILSKAAALDVRVAQRCWEPSAIPTLICFWKNFRVPFYDPEVNLEFRFDEPRWAPWISWLNDLRWFPRFCIFTPIVVLGTIRPSLQSASEEQRPERESDSLPPSSAKIFLSLRPFWPTCCLKV